MQPMLLYSAFFNVDGDIQLAYGDVVCTKGAAVVCLWDVVTGHKKHIYSQKHGFQCITANHRTQTILVAEYSQRPKIHVYSKGDKEFSLTQGVGTLEISKMELSNDGKHLLIVNQIPEYAISVIDMTTKQKIRGKNSVVPLNLSQNTELKQIIFHPADSNQFSVLYNNEVIVYKIVTDYQTNEEDVRENYRILEHKSIKGSGFKNIIYDSKGNLYATTDDRLYYLNRDSFNLNIFYSASDSSINSIVLTQRHLILLYQNGLIEWLNKFQQDTIEEKDETLRPFYKCYSANINPQIKSAVYNHDMNRLIVGHKNGLFTVIVSEAERGLKEREQDDHNAKGEDGDEEDKQEVSRQLNLEVILEGPFHTKTVTMIEELTSAAIAITAAMDGKIIFWNLNTKSIISSIQFQQQFVSGHLNQHQNLLVLGTSKGKLMLFIVSEQGKVSLIYQANISPNQRLDHVEFNPTSSLIAATSTDAKAVYFINVPSKGRCNVVGYFQTPSEIFNIAWNYAGKHSNNSQLFVLMNSLIGSIAPPSESVINALNRGEALKLDLEFFARKIDPDQNIISVLPSGDILVSGKDKILRKYKQPEQYYSKMDLKARTAPNPPIEQLDGHSLEPTTMRVSHKFNTVLSGGKDGTLIIRNGNNLEANTINIRSQSLKQNGVSSILISNSANFVIAGGFDGSLLVWAPQNIDFKSINNKKQKQAIAMKPIQTKGDKLEPFEEIQQKQYLKSIEAEIVEKKKAQMNKLNTLKNQLNRMLQQNSKHEQIQRLPRDEFAIDIESREKILSQGREICSKMRQESRKLNLKNQILSIKLKEKTWDQMEIQLRGMNGLRANILVYNYQIKKRNQKEVRLVKLILDMRRNAVKETRDRKQKGTQPVVDLDLLKNKCIVNGGYPTVLVLNDYQKVEQRKDEKMKKKKEEEQQKPKKEEPPQTDEEWGLLYSVFQLFADNAKRNQILMIRNLIFKIKETFNTEFDALLLQRQSSVDIINDKNKRIIEIYDELKKQLDLTQCNQNILQNPDRILSVHPKQVGFQRYLSREQRQKLERERLKEEQRLKLLAQDDGAQRALTKMMNNTLEEKKQSALEVVIEREKWMDKPLEQMNEDQKMKLKQYEVKKAKAEEQKQRTIKQLDTEIRKLKSQIEDVLQKFDQKLLVLFKRKLEYDYRIEEQQLYIQKLMESMVSFIEGEQKLKDLEINQKTQREQQQRMDQKIVALKNYSEQINKNKDAKRQALEARRGNQLEVRIKNVEKNVFQEFNNSNPKQKRKIRDKWIETQPHLARKIIKNDPYLAIESNLLWESKSKQFSTFLESIRAIQHNYEGNEQTLLNALETRFNLKKQEVDLEKKLININKFITGLEEENNLLVQQHKQIQKQIKDTKSYLSSSKSNIQVELRLKQGNVQLQSEKMVPQLSEAILLPRQAIQSKNHSILQSAGQKIEVMKKIKACKINVTEQELNLKNKVQQAQQLYNKIKAIQMLKVKKEMQTALVKKDIKMNENEIKSIQQQIDNLHREADKRAMVFQKKIEKINSDIGSIKKENEQLELQRQSLEETVKQRLKIEQMMNNQGTSGNESREKFEQISVNRKLFDTAKRQTEQIELLREELAKLKAKTFANFSNIQR